MTIAVAQARDNGDLKFGIGSRSLYGTVTVILQSAKTISECPRNAPTDVTFNA